jgi:hypothetical protein
MGSKAKSCFRSQKMDLASAARKMEDTKKKKHVAFKSPAGAYKT